MLLTSIKVNVVQFFAEKIFLSSILSPLALFPKTGNPGLSDLQNISVNEQHLISLSAFKIHEQ